MPGSSRPRTPRARYQGGALPRPFFDVFRTTQTVQFVAPASGFKSAATLRADRLNATPAWPLKAFRSTVGFVTASPSFEIPS